MRYPNLRYGNPQEFEYYTRGLTVAEVARRLRRSERIITDYLQHRQKLPWWIPELLRLQHMEHCERMRQMGLQRARAFFRTATLYEVEFPRKTAPRPHSVDSRGPAANSPSFALSRA